MAHVSPSGAELKLLWSQEFDEAAGSSVDRAFWNFDIGDGSEVGIPGWGNQEREWYLPEQAATDGNGSLVITATKLPADNSYMAYYGTPADWASAKLHTAGKVSVLHGRIEARVRVPKGAGTWPAFWMLGNDFPGNQWPNSGEIDIMEGKGANPWTVWGTVHGPGYFGGDGITNTWSLDKPLSSTYNVYAIEWFPNKINWYINNKLFHTVTPKSVGTNKWVFNKPFFMILNLAMGGRFTGDLDPDLTSAKMYVDYIRYYTINGQGKVIGTAAAIKAGKP